jgi:DNA-binding NarL/FixJ family response regulator
MSLAGPAGNRVKALPPKPPAISRIFIVDDHPLVREWMANLISQETDLVICGQADDAASALASVPLAKPDVVIVDLSLKRSSGLELIKDLRAQFPATKVIVLSMHEELNYVERAFRAGAVGYVAKRESSSKVVDAIRAVQAGKMFANEAFMAELTGRLMRNQNVKPGSADELLSDREMEVFNLRGQGKGAKEIADFLKVSVKTIESYEARIKEKLGYDNVNELVREAVRWHDRKNRL